jgi:ATP-dependent Clp protease ATP-binding subunit ClpC
LVVEPDGTGDSAAAFDSLLGQLLGAGPPPETPASTAELSLSSLLDAQAYEVVLTAIRATVEWGDPELDSTHLLWAVTQVQPTARMLRDAGVQVQRLADGLRASVPERAAPSAPRPAPTLSPWARRAMLGARRQALHEGTHVVAARHVLLGLATDADSVAGHALARAVEMRDRRGQVAVTSATPRLDEFGSDLTQRARAGTLDPVIGRGDEIEQAIEVLARRTKNNPVFVGDPGVGKTAIAEGLAQRIADGDIPGILAGKRLVSLDLPGMVAGVQYRGEFEQRFRDVLGEIRDHRDEVVVFLDELHSIVGTGAGDGGMDAGSLLKPALARGELRLIGATTMEEYRKHVERDPALERRLQPITVPELTVEQTEEVLRGLRDRYEQHHRVRIDDSAVEAAARLSQRYLTERFLPDKAVDTVDQACARVRLRAEPETQQPRVVARDIAEVVSRRTGIPVSDVTAAERQRLTDLGQRLADRVIGQDTAVRLVADAVRRARAGLSDPDRPTGSFLFLGPTGVGKTELARALATALFGDAERMLRLDMGEFQDKHMVARLVGAPPGYAGYGEAGQLTDRVRRRPYSVILLDEVDKAHPDVVNILLQVLDAGRLTDAQGRTVDFRDTVVIMTSNIAAEVILDNPSDPPMPRVLEELRGHFRAEFLNRIDEIVVFRPLTGDDLRQITTLLLQRPIRQLQAKGIHLEITEEAVRWLVRHGYHPEFGARPLRRVIQRELDSKLASLLLDEELANGSRVRVDVSGDALSVVPVTGDRAEDQPVPG